jgi:hypothetical protein
MDMWIRPAYRADAREVVREIAASLSLTHLMTGLATYIPYRTGVSKCFVFVIVSWSWGMRWIQPGNVQ